MAIATVNKSGSRKTAAGVDKNMKTHADDPFFVEKARRGKALIQKYGVPKATKGSH